MGNQCQVRVEFAELLHALSTISVPVIGVACGSVKGSGLALLAACDASVVVSHCTTFTFDYSCAPDVRFTAASISMMTKLVESKLGVEFARALFSRQTTLPAWDQDLGGLVWCAVRGGEQLSAETKLTTAVMMCSSALVSKRVHAKAFESRWRPRSPHLDVESTPGPPHVPEAHTLPMPFKLSSKCPGLAHPLVDS